MKTTTLFAALIFTLLFVSACSKEKKQLKEDVQLMKDYIDINGLAAESTSSSLYYVIDEPGNNEHPEAGDDIDFKYTGWFLDGEEFDSSDGKVVTFPLNNLIKGWKEGIPLFGKGGKGTLIIPSHLAYGPNGTQSGSIPPNAVIVFDIELINFN